MYCTVCTVHVRLVRSAPGTGPLLKDDPVRDDREKCEVKLVNTAAVHEAHEAFRNEDDEGVWL